MDRADSKFLGGGERIFQKYKNCASQVHCIIKSLLDPRGYTALGSREVEVGTKNTLIRSGLSSRASTITTMARWTLSARTATTGLVRRTRLTSLTTSASTPVASTRRISATVATVLPSAVLPFAPSGVEVSTCLYGKIRQNPKNY